MTSSRQWRLIVASTATFLIGALLLSPVAKACTRLVYLGANEQVITARSMDWKHDIRTNLWVFPRGMKRSGEAGPNSLQ
jgi:choloylglycine hydrolase